MWDFIKKALCAAIVLVGLAVAVRGQDGGGVHAPTATLATIGGGPLAPGKGGTGTANAATLTWSGFNLVFGLTASTTVFLPTSGTLATLAGAETLTNKTITSAVSVSATSFIRTVPVAVASLPAAATAGSGARAYVTDAVACTFLTTVAGGGSTACPVVSNGTNWQGG